MRTLNLPGPITCWARVRNTARGPVRSMHFCGGVKDILPEELLWLKFPIQFFCSCWLIMNSHKLNDEVTGNNLLMCFLWNNKLLFVHWITKYHYINVFKFCRKFWTKSFWLLPCTFSSFLAPSNTFFSKKKKKLGRNAHYTHCKWARYTTRKSMWRTCGSYIMNRDYGVTVFRFAEALLTSSSFSPKHT